MVTSVPIFVGVSDEVGVGVTVDLPLAIVRFRLGDTPYLIVPVGESQRITVAPVELLGIFVVSTGVDLPVKSK
jgi:hypothetical protein